VLAVLARFPRANRPWAPPVLVDPYRWGEGDRARRRPHRTPARVMARLLRVVLPWSPGRRSLLVGDAGYGTHELARFAHRRRPRLTLVSELHPEAELFEPPPPYEGNGRPPVKGPRRPEPRPAVAVAGPRAATVAWYGGGSRSAGVTSGTGHRSKAGAGPVEIAWAFVRDRTGTHRDESSFSTDAVMDPMAMVAAYTGRWNPEATFQPARRRPRWAGRASGRPAAG
jgi:hypothetical protein